MFEDAPLTITAVIALGTILGGAFTVYRWVQTAIESAKEKAADEVALAKGQAAMAITTLEKDLADFKLRVVSEFATSSEVGAAVTGVQNSVDKIINRIDSFAVEFNRALVKLAGGKT